MRKRVLFQADLSCGDCLSFEPYSDGSGIEIGGEPRDGTFLLDPESTVDLSKRDLVELWATISAALKHMKTTA